MTLLFTFTEPIFICISASRREQIPAWAINLFNRMPLREFCDFFLFMTVDMPCKSKKLKLQGEVKAGLLCQIKL